jgi:outer membrane protein assembly factor BamE (lipoprotein component of BamABCDE complex)
MHANVPSSITARILAGVFALVIAAGVSACAPRTTTRGNLPTEDKLSQVTVGVHKKDDVRTLLGAPSTIGTFEDSVWYYIGRRTTQFAFFRETIIDQKVIVLFFSEQGVVERLEVYDQDDLREISLVERKTPTAGHSLGFFEQILGNIGRFNK